jgi:hypothetical protein
MVKPVKSSAGNSAIHGSRFNDTLQGNGAGHVINGLSGDDTLLGWGVSYDAITGESAEDPAKAADEILNGGQGNDLLFGGAGNDVLHGGAGDDSLVGGSGQDRFGLSAGNDVIEDFSAMTTTRQVVLDFEGYTSAYSADLDGYKGLNWVNAFVLNAAELPLGDSGYDTVVTSGSYVGYDAYANGASFSDPAADFNFVSGYFAAAWNRDLVVTLNAYDDGQLVGTATLQLDSDVKSFVNFMAGTATGADSAVFSGRFSSIDAISMDGTGGTTQPFTTGFGTHIAMDDLVLQYVTAGDGDKIDSGEYAVAELLASAASDGNGGTVLTHATGTITLVGVAPSDVNADYFV